MTDVAHSSYGYWIEPSGIIHALGKPMAHAEWLSSDRRFADIGASDLMEHAIFQGWIGVSVSPVGNSVGVRVRPGSAEKKAARALGQIFKADDLWDREIYTDFASWTGRKLYNHLVRTGFNRDIFVDVGADIRYTETEIAERQAKISFIEAVCAAQAEGNAPDYQRLRELVSEVSEIAGKAYAHIEKISPVGDGIADIVGLRRYCRDQIDIFDGFRTSLEAPIAEIHFAFAGSPMPELHGEEDHLALVDRALPELQVLEQLKEIELALSARLSAASARAASRSASKELGNALRIVESIETGCGILVTSKLKQLEKVLADPEVTKENLEFSARYYIGHELARTFSVCGRMYARDLMEAVSSLEAGGAPSP